MRSQPSDKTVARREFIRRLGLGAVGAAALALTPKSAPRDAERTPPEREAEFYRRHDLAG